MTTTAVRTVSLLLSTLVTVVIFAGANGLAAGVYAKTDAAQPVLVAMTEPGATRLA